MSNFNFGALSGVTGAFSKAGLAEGTNANTIKTAAPNGAGTDFAIDGIAYHLADTDNIAMTALSVQADLTSCLYLIQVSSAGAVSIKKGNEELTADLGVNKSLQWPMPDDDRAPLGGFKVATSATTFTSGSTDLSAAGVTATFYDFMLGMPLAPQVA